MGWPSYCTEVGRVWQEACRESPERTPSDDCVGTRVCVGWLCVLVRDPPSLPVSQCVLFVPHMYVRCGVVWCVGGVVPWWHPPPTRSLRLPGILCEKLLTYLRGSWRPERDRASATRARQAGPLAPGPIERGAPAHAVGVSGVAKLLYRSWPCLARGLPRESRANAERRLRWDARVCRLALCAGSRGPCHRDA